MSNGVEVDVGALMETSPELREAFDNLQAAAAQVTWCDCPHDEQVPSSRFLRRWRCSPSWASVIGTMSNTRNRTSPTTPISLPVLASQTVSVN